MKLKQYSLFVGPLPDEKKKRNLGGATMLMKNWVEYLENKDVDYRFIQTNRFYISWCRPLQNAINALIVLIELLFKTPFSKIVIFNFSDHGVVYMYPLFLPIIGLYRKKVVLRKFGGSFDVYLTKVSKWRIYIVRKALIHTDMLFLETHASIAYMKRFIGENNIQWFPNVRKNDEIIRKNFQYKKRLVFLGHVKQEKGIDDLIQLKDKLPTGYSIDIYGELVEEKYKNTNWEKLNLNYCGCVSSKEIYRILQEYDILLLPSYREGYPGVIIEAFSVGIPCVAYDVGGIAEIITNGYNGIIVRCRDVKALVNAICSISEVNYQEYSTNARESFEKQFSSEMVNRKIMNLIVSLV